MNKSKLTELEDRISNLENMAKQPRLLGSEYSPPTMKEISPGVFAYQVLINENGVKTLYNMDETGRIMWTPKNSTPGPQPVIAGKS